MDLVLGYLVCAVAVALVATVLVFWTNSVEQYSLPDVLLLAVLWPIAACAVLGLLLQEIRRPNPPKVK